MALHCRLPPGYKERWEPQPVEECLRGSAASKSLLERAKLERAKSVLLDCSDSFLALAAPKYLAA